MQERLAKRSGDVAVIKVGAATETEMKENKARVEDALHATRAAVEEGIVPDGVAPLRAASALHGLKGDGGEHIGIDIIRSSCEEPCRHLRKRWSLRHHHRGKDPFREEPGCTVSTLVRVSKKIRTRPASSILPR